MARWRRLLPLLALLWCQCFTGPRGPTDRGGTRCRAGKTSRGKDLEAQIRGDGGEDPLGPYVISSRAPVLVAPNKDLGTPIAELSTGQVVEVLECAVLQEAERIRGRLAEPQGWISLRNPSSGFRWACPKQSQDQIEADLQQLEDLATKEDTPEAAEANADLLYLRALQKQSSAGLPLLQSFESDRTWPLFGRGLERWNAVAGGECSAFGELEVSTDSIE
eukprot:Skav218720  [mRNA]  locus=scaffold1346:723503:724162:+ [translate_table: standard]